MLEEAARKYKTAKVNLDQARMEVVEAIVSELRSGETPTEVAKKAPFTPVYVRRIAREHGIEPAPPGPKPRKAAR